MDKVIESFINKCDEMMITEESLISKIKDKVKAKKEEYQKKMMVEYQKVLQIHIKNNSEIIHKLISNCKNTKIKEELNILLHDLEDIKQASDNLLTIAEYEALIKKVSSMDNIISRYTSKPLNFDNSSEIHQIAIQQQQMMQQHLQQQQILQQQIEQQLQQQLLFQQQMDQQVHQQATSQFYF